MFYFNIQLLSSLSLFYVIFSNFFFYYFIFIHLLLFKCLFIYLNAINLPVRWMDYLGKGEVLTNTDLDRFVNNIWGNRPFVYIETSWIF